MTAAGGPATDDNGRGDERPTFDELLRDPNEQFDVRSELLASIDRYMNAPPATWTAPTPARPGTADDAPTRQPSGLQRDGDAASDVGTADELRDRDGLTATEQAIARVIWNTFQAQYDHEDVPDIEPRTIARAITSLPRVQRLLAVERRVRDALDTEEAYTQAIEPTDIPKSEYGPSEWRLHGDARGRRMVIAEIRTALGGGDKTEPTTCTCGPGYWGTCDQCGADAWVKHRCPFPCDDVTCENGALCIGCLTGRPCPVHNDDWDDHDDWDGDDA